MLINAERQPADQDAGDLCDPTQYAPRDRRPYWNEDIASFSAAVWLPTGTADRGAAINRPHGWSSKTAAHSWFSTNRIAAPNPDLPGLYSPAAVQDIATRATAGATKQQTRRIQVYPGQRTQKLAIATWLTASRWTYNLTAEILQSGIPAIWKPIASMVMPEVKTLHPEWDSVPYQVKRTAVRDALPVHVQHQDLQLGTQGQTRHTATEPTKQFAQLSYRSRKNPRQSCYIPDDAVTEHGVYHTMLGPLRMAEAIPAEHKECRLVQERGRYWLVVPYPAQCDIETPSGDGVVALDPGVRTFLTYFSETDCGKIGHHAFGRIQRLCHWLDDLISRTAKEPHRRRRRQMRSAQVRTRQRITNLVDELHWQLVSLVDQQLPDHPATYFRDPGHDPKGRPQDTEQDHADDAHFPPLRVQAASCGGKPGSAAHWCSTSTRRTPARPAVGTVP